MIEFRDILAWPQPSRLLRYEDIPIGRDLLLVGSGQLEELRRDWSEFLSALGRGQPCEHDDKIEARFCAIETRRDDSCDLNVCITMATRYHGVVKKLPRSKFVLCVFFSNNEKRPYLVVDQAWFDEVATEKFSLYALIDAIGMRALLDRQGRVTAEQVAHLRDGIDELARDHPDHAFLSFADNLLVKSNWVANGQGYETTYRPEAFIELTGRVCAVIKDALGLESYVVATQGANAADDGSLLHVSNSQNHVFFGSLATPFAELFDIDRAVRSSIRDGRHSPRELYLSASFFWSLRRSLDGEEAHPTEKFVPFKSELTAPDLCSYLPIDRVHLRALLREGYGSSE